MRKPPKLCRNKAKNFAYVYVDRKQFYLGKWGAPETQAAYDRFVIDWAKANKIGEQVDPRSSQTLLLEMVCAFVEEFKARPVRSEADLNTYLLIMSRITELFPDYLADDFRIRDLEMLRDSFQQKGYDRRGKHREHARTYLNKIVNRTKSIFTWGVSKEMVSSETANRLKFLPPLRKGRTTAPEPRGRHSVSDADFNAVSKFLPAYYQDIVELLRITGMRPSELTNMRVGAIDQTPKSKIWKYSPEHHKTESTGAARIISLGERAQKILAPHLKGREPEEFVFTPARAMESRWAIQRKNRKSPLQPSQVEREKKRAPNKTARFSPQLTPRLIGKVVRRSCEKAIEEGKLTEAWTPYELRHTAITEIRIKYGAEAAQHFAGHSNLNTKKFYDHSADVMAEKIAAEMG